MNNSQNKKKGLAISYRIKIFLKKQDIGFEFSSTDIVRELGIPSNMRGPVTAFLYKFWEAGYLSREFIVSERKYEYTLIFKDFVINSKGQKYTFAGANIIGNSRPVEKNRVDLANGEMKKYLADVPTAELIEELYGRFKNFVK